ncbi:MAG: hypothetical protein WC759_01080 [Candidatus Micrarchaeia archaeon]|jgi:hypothetical protein
MGKKNEEPRIDIGLFLLGVLFVALGLAPAYMSTFMQYAPCLNGIPIAEQILSCSGGDYLIGGSSLAAAWGSFLLIGLVLGAAAFIPAARIFVRIGFILLLVLWVLGIFGVKII